MTSNFSTGTTPLILNTVKRERTMTEEDRRSYATELIDTYDKFGMKYVKAIINDSITNDAIKTNMNKIAVCYPLLTNFINEISVVYRNQPIRKFYKEGKLIVDEVDTDLADKDKYHEDPKLLATLNGLYNNQFVLQIRKAEQMANLLSTVIYKINFRENRYSLDFIPNDTVVVLENEVDASQSEELYFLKSATTDHVSKNTNRSYELWTPEVFEQLSDGVSTVKTNRAVESMHKYFGDSEVDHIGSGFPPFAVLRPEMATSDFWNIKGKDVIDLIKQINVAFTELRYLQRFGSFGLKYIIGAKLPQDRTLDLLGIIELLPAKDGPSIPGQTNPTEPTAGEFKNEGRIMDMIDSIFKMITFLYDMFGINVNRLIATGDAESAESKKLDVQSLRDFIEGQQDIWMVNEEHIFNTLLSVYNRDHVGESALPKDLTIAIDYADSADSADEVAKIIEARLVKIQNNIMSYVDWMQEENPDLSEEEALLLIQRNKSINESHQESFDDDSDGNDEIEE
ncbi:MAG: hypothetical protein ACTSW1_08180 [Candidatus Hodarchaeales archaeon]